MTIYQYKELHWDVVPQKISGADKLNGTDWRAIVVVKASAVREYWEKDFDLGTSEGWRPWEEFLGLSPFEQKRTNGSWEITEDSLGRFGSDQISCSEVVELLKKGNSQ